VSYPRSEIGRKRALQLRLKFDMEVVSESSADRVTGVQPKSRQKSRITNGSALLPGVDGRSPWIRRCKDVIASHLSDAPDASAAERSIIRRASVLTVELERMERQFALAGEANPAQLDLYARVAANLRRLLEAVGLERRAKTVTADGVEIEAFSPMRARWAAEEAAAAKGAAE
jgi:hypothetical protein